MYYGYSIFSGKDKSNYIRGGEYTGINLPPERISNESGNFIFMRDHSNRTQICEIDDLLYEVNEEYVSLSKSVINASEVVRGYVKLRIDELQTKRNNLQTERKKLLLEVF